MSHTEGEPFCQRLNRHVRGLRVSATFRADEQGTALERTGRPVFRLGLGQSPFPIPPMLVEELQRAAHRRQYLPVKGLPELREAVADHHRRTCGVPCSADNVLVGPGSKELIFLLQLCYRGEIVIPSPSWVSYGPQARMLGRKVARIPTRATNGWRLTAEELHNWCRQRPGRAHLLVLNYPSNPTGGTYAQDELRELASVARKHQVLILSDEIYGKLHHRGQHHSIVPFHPAGTIFSGGLSKWCGAGGWRLGIFVIPDTLRCLADIMAAAASETFSSTSTPVQYAGVKAFAQTAELEPYLDAVRRILSALGGRLAKMLEHGGAFVPPPEGGFYLFPDYSRWAKPLRRNGIRSSAALCERLLGDTGVVVLPGSAFGRPASELTVRLAYVDFDGQKALDALSDRVARRNVDDAFLDEYCAPVIEGTKRLVSWIEAHVADRVEIARGAAAVVPSATTTRVGDASVHLPGAELALALSSGAA